MLFYLEMESRDKIKLNEGIINQDPNPHEDLDLFVFWKIKYLQILIIFDVRKVTIDHYRKETLF